MIKYLNNSCKILTLLTSFVLVSACSISVEEFDQPNLPNEQLESNFFDCPSNSTIELIVIPEGKHVSPYIEGEFIHLNLAANQNAFPKYIDQLNNELSSLNKPYVNFALNNVYALHYYYNVQSTSGVVKSKVCYSSSDQSVVMKVYIESLVGGSGHDVHPDNLYLIIPKTTPVNQIRAILKNQMCESNPFVVDCEIETLNCDL